MEQQLLSSTQLSFWLNRLSHPAESARATGSLMGWYQLAVNPQLTIQSLTDPLQLRTRLGWLREQLNIWLSGADRLQAAAIYLSFLELSLLNDPSEDMEFVQERLAEIDANCSGEQSALMQAYGRIVLAGLLSEHAIFNISHQRFAGLLEQIPSGRGNLEIWYGAALWAYQNKHMDVLEQALEFCVMGFSGRVDEQVWRMCNLMYRLSSGRAISQDVENLIHSFEHPVQLSHFREDLLDDCQEAGLMNRELQYWLEHRDRELRRQQLQVAAEVQAAG
jgi:hypothetical protein